MDRKRYSFVFRCTYQHSIANLRAAFNVQYTMLNKDSALAKFHQMQVKWIHYTTFIIARADIRIPKYR